MSLDSLKAALDAPRSAKEARHKAIHAQSSQPPYIINKTIRDLFKLMPDASKNHIEARIKDQWKPPGYILPYELATLLNIEIPQAYWLAVLPCSFSGWSKLPQEWPLPEDKKLIALGHFYNLIQENKYKTISLKGPKPWQTDYDWFYILRTGEYQGAAKTKEEAESGWLKEAKFVLTERHEHNLSLKQKQEAQKILLRGLIPLREKLYKGEIAAYLHDPKNGELKRILNNFWGTENAMEAFDFFINIEGKINIPRKFLEGAGFGYHETGNETTEGTILFAIPQPPQKIETSEKSDINFFSSGIAYISSKYDERLGEKKTETAKEKTKKPRGRKKGTGVIPGDDDRVKTMKALIDDQKAKSVNDAASQTVRSQGKSGTSEESDIRRLTRKYNLKYST